MLHTKRIGYSRRLFIHQSGQYWQKIKRIQPASQIAYWPLWDLSGSQAMDISPQLNHGAHAGVTLGQPGIGDGRTCPFYDGANDYTNIYSANLAADFDEAEGTALIWFKAYDVGMWTDGLSHNLLQLRADASNRVILYKGSTGSRILAEYTAGGVVKNVVITPLTSVTWNSVGLTWSVAADQVKVFFNGAQYGSTLTGLGTWAGALSNTRSNIGADSTAPSSPWYGWLAHCVLWSTPLSVSEMGRAGKL